MIHLPFPHASLLPSHLEGEGERRKRGRRGGKKGGRKEGEGEKRRMGEKKLKGKGTFLIEERRI